MSDLVQQGVTQQDCSVTAGLLAVSTFAPLTVGLSWLQLAGAPHAAPDHRSTLLVFGDGGLIEDAMKSQRLSMAGFLVATREQGIRSMEEIEYAILEADGRLSFFTGNQPRGGTRDTPVG